MDSQNTVVAVFPSPADARDACIRLRDAGVYLGLTSAVGKGHHIEEQASGYYERSGPHLVGRHRSEWQDLWKTLGGSAFLWVPSLGPLIIAGPLSGLVVAELQGTMVVGGMSVLGASLMALSVPGIHAMKYEVAVLADQLLLVAQWEGIEAVHGFQALRESSPLELELHAAATAVH
jgi:hypothetical protein